MKIIIKTFERFWELEIVLSKIYCYWKLSWENNYFCKNSPNQSDRGCMYRQLKATFLFHSGQDEEYYCKNDLRIGWILWFLWKYPFVEYRRLLLFTFPSSHSNFLKPPFFLHSQSSYWHFHLGPEQLCSQRTIFIKTDFQNNFILCSILWNLKV